MVSGPTTPEGGPEGSSGPSIPPESLPSAESFGEMLKGILDLGGGEKSKDITALEQATDQLLAGDITLTPELLNQLTELAKSTLDNPQLSAPDKALIDLFQAKVLNAQIQLGLSGTAGTAGGVIPVAGGNRFLDCSAITELYSILCDLAIQMSQIKLAESKLKVDMALMTIQMAEDMADLIKELGELAAKKALNQASELMVEGVTAFGQAALAAVTIVLTASQRSQDIEAKSKQSAAEKYTQWVNNGRKTGLNAQGENLDPYGFANYTEPTRSGSLAGVKGPIPPGTDPNDAWYQANKSKFLSAYELTQIESSVQTRVSNFMKTFESSFTGLSALFRAGFKFELAGLEKQSSLVEAAKSQLQTLMEMINKTGDTLSKEVDEEKSALQKLAQMFEEIARVYGQLGSSRG